MTSSAAKDNPKQQLFFEKVLSLFSKRFSKPTADLLSVRCISKFQLQKQLISIRDDLDFSGYKKITGKELLSHLENSGLAFPIHTINPNSNNYEDRIYVIGLESSASLITPIELLQAELPSGVVCYFTALEYHGLTTQTPSHHHIAKLVPGTSASKKIDIKQKESNEKETVRSFNPFGTMKFIYDEKPYYVTNRDINLVPGVQERYLNDKTRFRITNYEQTLLDTLHRPINCGGTSVVFEAWSTALDNINSQRLYSLLIKINNELLSRRVGYMLENIGFNLDDNLFKYFESTKKKILKKESDSIATLLPGIEYNQLDQDWFLRVP